MKLKVSRDKSQESGFLGGKKDNYSLIVQAELDNDEIQMLTKYGFFNNEYVIDPTISATIEVKKEIKGPAKITINQLQQGTKWSCNHLPVEFVSIPSAISSLLKRVTGVALARESWGGEETIDLNELDMSVE